ncbi:hypothetical protein HDK64DRAFT_277955 [Phyllosticta capitalensis]
MRREGLLHSDAKSARAMKSWPIFPNFHAFCFFSFLSALGKWSSGMGPAVGTLFFSSTPSIDFFPSHCTSCTYGVLFFCTLPLLNPSTAVGSRARIVAGGYSVVRCVFRLACAEPICSLSSWYFCAASTSAFEANRPSFG